MTRAGEAGSQQVRWHAVLECDWRDLRVRKIRALRYVAAGRHSRAVAWEVLPIGSVVGEGVMPNILFWVVFSTSLF